MSDYLMGGPHGAAHSGCDRVICALKYTDMVKSAMTKFKFSQRAEFGPTFGAILAEKIRRVEGPGIFSVATAIPLGEGREKERGFNQAGIIAKYVAMHLNVRYCHDLLDKREGAMRQSGLTGAQRDRNAKESFALAGGVKEKGLVKGQAILLIDDVSTTLSTINAGAALLKGGGAALVVGAVVASGMAGRD